MLSLTFRNWIRSKREENVTSDRLKNTKDLIFVRKRYFSKEFKKTYKNIFVRGEYFFGCLLPVKACVIFKNKVILYISTPKRERLMSFRKSKNTSRDMFRETNIKYLFYLCWLFSF